MIRLGLCATFLLGGLLMAAEPLSLPTDRVSVEMAAPPLEGTVSIGVFDASGKCIRLLAKNSPSDKIPSALNGFLLTWDGRNDAGEIAGKGTYEIHGVTVGNIKIEGVAYHFNDWIDPEKASNPPIRTLWIKLLPDADFLAIQQLANEDFAISRYSEDGKMKWTQPLSAPATGFAIDSSKAWLAANDQLTSFDLQAGTSSKWPESFPKITLLTTNNAGLFAIIADSLVFIDPATHQVKPIAKLPADIKLLTSRGNILLVSNGTDLFRLAVDHFEKLSFSLPAIDLEAGKENEFWVVGPQNSLTEYNLQGEALRNLEPLEGEVFRSVSASTDDASIALVNKKNTGNVTRILERTAAPTSDVSLWKTKLLKEILPIAEFGIDPQTLRPVAAGSLPSEKNVAISLVANPLAPGVSASIDLKSATFDGGVWVFAADGLPLFPVITDSKSSRHILLRSKKPRELSLFVGANGAVEEFALRGLENMIPFGGDKIQWPPGPRQAADEDHVPEKAPAPTP